MKRISRNFPSDYNFTIQNKYQKTPRTEHAVFRNPTGVSRMATCINPKLPQNRMLLEGNEQSSQGGENAVRERLADRMAFGALEACPDCHGNSLELGSARYGLVLRGKCMAVALFPEIKAWNG